MMNQMILLNDGYQTVRGGGTVNPQMSNHHLKSFAQIGGGQPPSLEVYGPGSPLLSGVDDQRTTHIIRPVVFASSTLRHSTALHDNGVSGKPAGIVIGKIFL